VLHHALFLPAFAILLAAFACPPEADGSPAGGW
jgi:hypothetical protein